MYVPLISSWINLEILTFAVYDSHINTFTPSALTLVLMHDSVGTGDNFAGSYHTSNLVRHLSCDARDRFHLHCDNELGGISKVCPKPNHKPPIHVLTTYSGIRLHFPTLRYFMTRLRSTTSMEIDRTGFLVTF